MTAISDLQNACKSVSQNFLAEQVWAHCYDEWRKGCNGVIQWAIFRLKRMSDESEMDGPTQITRNSSLTSPQGTIVHRRVRRSPPAVHRSHGSHILQSYLGHTIYRTNTQFQQETTAQQWPKCNDQMCSSSSLMTWASRT